MTQEPRKKFFGSKTYYLFLFHMIYKTWDSSRSESMHLSLKDFTFSRCQTLTRLLSLVRVPPQPVVEVVVGARWRDPARGADPGAGWGHAALVQRGVRPIGENNNLFNVLRRQISFGWIRQNQFLKGAN